MGGDNAIALQELHIRVSRMGDYEDFTSLIAMSWEAGKKSHVARLEGVDEREQE